MNEHQAVVALGALAQTLRLRLFRALVVAGPEGLTPGQLAAALDAAPNVLSFHLKALVHAHLVTQERQGRHLVYRAAFAQMDALIAYLTSHCCQGQPCLAAPAACQAVPGASHPPSVGEPMAPPFPSLCTDTP